LSLNLKKIGLEISSNPISGRTKVKLTVGVRSQQELPELHFLRQTTEFMSDYLLLINFST
jgi:hypothetical protein